MNNRRDFLKFAGAVAISSMLPQIPGFAKELTTKKTVGLQLYSLRKDMSSDPKGTLQKVAEIGYKTLETASYSDGKVYGMTPKDFKTYINSLGMKLRSAHLMGPQDALENKKDALAWWTKAISDHKLMGAKYVIKPSMPIPTTLSELDKWCKHYNEIGALAKKAGLKFGFHNHSREFEKIEGVVMMDYMIENTNPQLVCFELDVYWSMVAGVDGAQYIKKYPGRFPLLHIKDEEEIGASGKVNFQSIFDAAYQEGMKDYFVEVEKYNYEPVESVKRSFEYLNNASYVK
jgi:sugar phosphate isomerase/epimerase